MSTSEEYQGGLTADSFTNYEGRVKYSDFIENKKKEINVKFLDTVQDKILYGFLDHEGFVVEPNPELKYFGDYAGEIQGLNYVVECFNNFRDFYINFVSQSPDVVTPPQIQGLIVKRSHESLSEKYTEYQKLVSQVLIEPFSTGQFSGARILPFEEFVNALNEIIFYEQSRQYKVTKLGYILSRYVTIYQTGIYIDLAPELSPNIDYVKVDMVSHPGFECYGEIANKYGFYVDQNCPWRLVLDLESEPARANILNSDFSRPFDDFYSQQYLLRVGGDDYWEFKSFYTRMYLKYLQMRQIATFERSVIDTAPEQTWIKSYLLNRLRELGELKLPDIESSDLDPTPGKKQYENILTEALNKYNILHMQGLTRLTHNSGVILYIEQECTNLLKKRIERTKSDIADSRR